MPRIHQLIRFIVAGTANTAFSYGIYVGLLWLDLPYPLASFASMIGGVTLGFVLQGHFVFGRFETRRFPLFAATWLVLWGLNVAVIAVLLPRVNGNAYAAGALSLCVMVPLSFLVQKYLVFGGGSAR